MTVLSIAIDGFWWLGYSFHDRAIYRLSMCYLCYLCAIYVLSMCYLYAIYVLSMCYLCAIYMLFIQVLQNICRISIQYFPNLLQKKIPIAPFLRCSVDINLISTVRRLNSKAS